MTNISHNSVSRLRSLRLPRVCVALTGSDPDQMLEKAEFLVRDNTFLEFRLDYLAKPAAALPKIKEFLDYRPHVFAIGTCRREVNGGKFHGSVDAQLEILTKAAESGCQLVDVELETAAKLKPAVLEKLRTLSALILSHHDFRATKKLEETLEAMTKIPADFYKIVSTAGMLFDNVTLMKFVEKHSRNLSLVGICMGEQGIISRVLSVRAGSIFTFAAVSPDEKTAPGQVTAQELRSTYRIDQVDAATRVYGVAGDPVAQSLGPIVMNTALRRETVNGVYLALHAKTLKDLLACVRDIPLHGLSITMPYKQAIVEYLDNSDAHTAKIGACNTVVRAQDGKLYGFNTDTAGVVRPLEQRIVLQDAKILVLGAGGAGRAAAFGLRERGAEIFILNRTAETAQKLARQVHGKSVKRADLKKLNFDVIINATPIGMGNLKDSPLEQDEIRAKYVFDMVYDPIETKLLTIAKEAGAAIIPGLEMFVHQAARQFEIWTGKPAPWDDMLKVSIVALQDRAAKAAAAAAEEKPKVKAKASASKAKKR